MKITEIRKMSADQLKKQLAAMREQVRDLQFKIHSKEVKNHHTVKSIKKDIARVLTVLRSK